jgi:hypothetical protein
MVRETHEPNLDGNQMLPESVETAFFRTTSHWTVVSFDGWKSSTPSASALGPQEVESPLINNGNLPGVNDKWTGEWPIIQFAIRSTDRLDLEIKNVIHRHRQLLDDHGVIVLRPNNLLSEGDTDVFNRLLHLENGSSNSMQSFLFEHTYKQVEPCDHDVLLHCRSRVTLTPKSVQERIMTDPTHELVYGLKQMARIHHAAVYAPMGDYAKKITMDTNIPPEVADALMSLPMNPKAHIYGNNYPLVIRGYSHDIKAVVNAINPQLISFIAPDTPLKHAFHFLEKSRESLMDVDESSYRKDNWSREYVPGDAILHADSRYTHQTSKGTSYAPVYNISVLLYGEEVPRNWVLLNQEQKEILENDIPDDPAHVIIPPLALASAGIPFVTGQQKKGDIVITAPGTVWYNWGTGIHITLEKMIVLDSSFKIPVRASDEISQAFLALAEAMERDRKYVGQVWDEVESQRLAYLPAL